MVIITISSCKKKTEDPIPEDPFPESSLLVFRPKKIFVGPDSAQPKLWAEVVYDELGRVKERITYTEGMLPIIEYIKETRTYTPTLVYVKRTFLNHGDQKFYTSGFDSLILQNDRIVRTASLYTYQGTAVSGDNTTGVNTRSTYTYRQGDSLEVDVYRNINYDDQMENVHYTFFKNGRLKGYSTTEEGKIGPTGSVTIVHYAGINGKFERGTNPFQIGIEFIDLPTEVHYASAPDFSSVSYTQWHFDQEKRPVAATVTSKTGSDGTKTYYRFEY